ncbi:UNC93-like protein [Alternaria arborescens]|uniref:UNC93-like protein n=1 Tax=Alternaria arborescens TaxID=156630 RepID=UPI001075325C|nr:UNC93-like protein [Alternaria arborescens]RYO42737.1 UNC93-like protein [Alternaria arborescens]
MAGPNQSTWANTRVPVRDDDQGSFERRRGWKYRSLRIGPVKLPYYASPESQLILVSFVCFLCPGMFNAVNGIGAAGLDDDAHASNAANTTLYATFAVVGFFAGTITNVLGIRIALSFGGLGYCIYVSALLCFNKTQNLGYVVFSGFLLGCCAGILWASQGAIMMSYPAVIGGFVQLALNFNTRGGTKAAVTNGTYIGFMILTFFGACLSWTLIDAKHVVRRDGSGVIMMKHPTWQTEIFGLWETLRTDPYIILLFPMFFASNWFYTYQFNDVNYARFNVRTRALNNTLYWLAQIFGAAVFGFALDFPNVRRTTRAKIAWVTMLVLTFAVWGGGYVFQRQYSRDDNSLHYDWTHGGYGGPMVLYMSYGFYDAAWQTCVYWFMGAISNNSRKLANFAGFYKGIQSAGAAIVFRIDGYKRPYMDIFLSSWVMLAASLVIALPVMLLKIKDTVPLEEDLRFTDETIEDVLGRREGYLLDEPEKA